MITHDQQLQYSRIAESLSRRKQHIDLWEGQRLYLRISSDGTPIVWRELNGQMSSFVVDVKVLAPSLSELLRQLDSYEEARTAFEKAKYQLFILEISGYRSLE